MKQFITLLLFAPLFTIGIAQSPVIYKKAKITYNNSANYRALSELGVPMDHGQHKLGVFLISDFSESEIEIAKNLGLEVEILVEDSAKDFITRKNKAFTQKSIQNPVCPSDNTSVIAYPTPVNFKLGSMGGYLTYQEMLDNLDNMHEKYPSLISSRENVGDFLTNGTPDTSVSPSIGGNALQWVRISDNPNTDETDEPEILYNSIHHAREPASLSQLIYYMWYLLENYETNEEVKNIVDTTELYFIPVVNPDGYLYNEKTNPEGGGLWRKNRFNSHGVDINRNYDHYVDGTPATAVWNTVGASSNPNSNTYAGTSAFSEVEIQAMKWFYEQHDFTISIDNHTSGDLLLLPYGFERNNPTPDGDIYQVISEEMVSQNNYNNILITDLTVAAGGSVDYTYGGTTRPHKKIFGFGTEIGPEFWPAPNLIDGICKEMMYLNLIAAKLVHNYSVVKDLSPKYVEQTSFNSSYEIKRLGLLDSGEDYLVSIIPVSSNISGVGNPKSYDNMTIGQTQEDFINVTLSSDIEEGSLIIYDLRIDNGAIKETKRIEKIFGTLSTVVANDANSLDSFTNQGWGVTNTTFVSSTGSLTDSPQGNYASNENKTIELSDAINLANATVANVSFYAKWDIEQNWDYTQFEVSTDNGITWIPQCGLYTNPGSSNNSQPTNEPLYDGRQTEWVLEQIDLSDYLGQTIKLRFQFVSDGASQADGFYFDDLKINTIDSSTLGLDNNVKGSFKIFPNPAEHIIIIQPRGTENYSLQLKNTVGQQILEKKDVSGDQDLDLRNYTNGLYFLSITQDGNTNSFKIIKK